MAPASTSSGLECAPESAAVSERQRELISEMLLRLDDALVAGAPLFAQQRMLSDLSVYASLLVRSRNPCSFEDAGFLHKLSTLEASLALHHRGLDPSHLKEIRRWFAAQFANSPP